MSDWVKCTRSDGRLPIFVNIKLAQTISQEAPGAISTVKFNAGFVQVEETPERLLGDFRDVTLDKDDDR